MPNQFNASLWGDEAFSAILAQKSPWEIITILTRDTSPPAYYFFEHFWMKIFGTSEIAIRALSFVLFLIGVFFIYKIGSLVWDKKTGVIAAVLTFLNPFLFIYAFEGRMYSIMVAGVSASMYFFLKRNWIPYVLATTIALYSHHFAIFSLGVQGLWWIREFFWGNKKIAISMFKSFIAVFVLYVPWLYPLYLQTTLVGGGFWLGRPKIEDLFNLVGKFISQESPHPLALPALFILVLILVLRNWQKKKEQTLFFSLWFFIPMFLTFAISQIFQPIFLGRYLLYTIGGILLIFASNRTRITSFLIIVSIVVLVVVDLFYFTHPTKRPFRELANYVKETKISGDFLINHNSSAHHLWESKYYGIPAPIWVPQGDLPFYVGTALMVPQDLAREIPKGATRVGAISSGNLDELTLPGYTKEEIKNFGRGLTFAWYAKTNK